MRYAVRKQKFLVFSFDFNPFIFIDFITQHIDKLPFVIRIKTVSVYADGTGYCIAEIDKKIFPELIDKYIQLIFKQYFFS